MQVLELCGVTSWRFCQGSLNNWGQLPWAQAALHTSWLSPQHSINLSSETLCTQPSAIKWVNAFRTEYQNMQAVSWKSWCFM